VVLMRTMMPAPACAEEENALEALLVARYAQ
jgi:hypothetical protein